MRWLPVVYFPLVLLISIVFLSEAARNAEVFSRWYGLLLALVIFTVLALLIVIGRNFYRLLQRYRSRELGSRLSMRLFSGFMLLTIVPALFIYLMSVSFVHRSVDSWFDSGLESTLATALDNGQQAMAVHHSKLQAQLEVFAEQAGSLTGEEQAMFSQRFPFYQKPVYLAFFSAGNMLTVFHDLRYSLEPDHVLPDKDVVRVLEKHESIFFLDFVRQDKPFARFYVPMRTGLQTPAAVIAVFPVDQDVGQLAQDVQQAYASYQKLKFSREPLKMSFVLTLSLALLQAVLTAMWAALFFSNRLVVPIRALAVGTREVAVGQYGKLLEPVEDEEMNTLIQSFNDMTNQVERAQDEARKNQSLAEAQRLYLQTVMSRLSSGVLTFDTSNKLLSSNSAAEKMLGKEFRGAEGQTFIELFSSMQELKDLLANFFAMNSDSKVLREQVTLNRPNWHRILMVSISRLPSAVGWVMVVDDITQIVEAQRQQAWGEVARRMAHEIKNPLTPIQLSAERLRHKYMADLSEKDAESFDKLTSSIIAQVDSMKELLKSFADYTRLPEVNPSDADINELVTEVMAMYRDVTDVQLELHLAQEPLVCPIDRLMIRQVLHNLMKNALHATREFNGERIVISTESQADLVVVNIDDQGGGVEEEVAARIFDPYFTTKMKGSGLGLAIAKKIMQEHGGDVIMYNRAPAGARFQLRFQAGIMARGPGNGQNDRFSA